MRPCRFKSRQPLIWLLLGILSAAALHAQVPAQTDWPRLERGEILIASARSPSGTPGLVCLFLVSGERSALFARLRDPAFFRASYRNIKETRVLRQYPDGEDIEFVLDAIIRTVRYTVTRRTDERTFEVTWTRIGGDLKDISGRWAVEESPYPGRCLVIYESYVDPGGAVNVALYSLFARMQARSNLTRLRAILEGKGDKPSSR